MGPASNAPDLSGVPLGTFEFAIAGRTWTIQAARDHDSLLAASERFTPFPYGLLLWESAPVLARWLAEQPLVVRGRRVLELGAGTGLAGLVARHLGAAVVQTDHSPEALQLCQRNARANGIEDVRVVLADWTRWELDERFDVILGADVLYDPAIVPPLMEVLEKSLAGGGTIVLTDPRRAKATEAMARLRAGGWTLVAEDIGGVTLVRMTRA